MIREFKEEIERLRQLLAERDGLALLSGAGVSTGAEGPMSSAGAGNSGGSAEPVAHHVAVGTRSSVHQQQQQEVTPVDYASPVKRASVLQVRITKYQVAHCSTIKCRTVINSGTGGGRGRVFT
jgi:hypothetical protein